MNTEPKTPEERIISVIEGLARQIVTKPDSLEIDHQLLAIGRLCLVPAPEDTSYLIGPQGRNFKALLKLVELANRNLRSAVRLMPVPEPEGGRREKRSREFVIATSWDHATFTNMLRMIAAIVFRTGDRCEVRAKDHDQKTIIYTVELPPQEDRRRFEEVQPVVETLFESIGKARGKILCIEIKHAA